MLGGAFNLIDGIVTLVYEHFFAVDTGHYVLLVTSNRDAWGWTALCIGMAMLVTGWFILTRGSGWSRVTGIVIAGLDSVFQLLYLPHFPLWSMIMILVDVLVIFGLAVPADYEEA